ILDFDRRMAQISVEQFHEDILKRLQVKHLVCGQDFHYASKGSGSIETLSHCEDFQLHVVEAVLDNQQRISSTLIEQFIQQGEMQECKRQMGRAFALKGIITKGNQMGRKYGFPTANLKLEDAYIIPKKGVYAGYVEYAQQYYPAIINIGHNPSFNYSLKTSIEAHILDFNQDIYGQRCTFHFEAYLRGEVCFEGMEALATQLKKDELQARMILKGVGS
ncbi:MAG: riboflavin biosynthesis protein RibF, partial [Longicatena sp.]|nr:riboflavin biosynthesis protein RibF [Longicatena sp.]